MIDARKRLHAYLHRGLVTEQGVDKPGKIYPLHAHECTVSGSLLLERPGQEAMALKAGDETIIDSGKPHQATVGETGWKYIAAWNPAEAKLYESKK